MEPIAYVEFEGGMFMPWGTRRPGRLHAIVFDDGSVFDAVNGWRHGPDAEVLARVQALITQRECV